MGDRKVTWIRAKCKGEECPNRAFSLLFLKLALQEFDFVGQREVLGDQGLDLAHRVEHGGVVPAAKSAADFGSERSVRVFARYIAT